MAQKQTRTQVPRGDNEVELRREMGDWKKILEILEPTKGKGTTSAEPLMNFLFGECKLEQWLEEHQPAEKYISKAKSALIDVKKTIILCLSQTGDQSGLQTDAHILLAKINYASGLYEEALTELEKSRFEHIDVVAQTVRNLQLMAEANAIKGFCLEKLGRSWKSYGEKSELERKKEIINLYLKSSDLALAHFQALEKVVQQNSTPTSTTAPPISSASTSPSPNPFSGSSALEKKRASSLLDYAIRRGPNLLFDDNQVDEGMKRIQWMLRSKETHLFAPIRLVLCRKLVEVLIRHKWTKSTLPLGGNEMKPKYYTGAKIFDPANRWEEIFLVLLLAEGMVVRDGVLNQAPEFSKARKLANINAATIFNLLALVATRWGQFPLLNESLEKALKFSFEEPHIWRQYGLTFHAMGLNSKRSIATLSEAARINPNSTYLLLMAAKEQFSRLSVEAGLELVLKAKAKESDVNHKIASRIHLYEGIAHFLRSFERHINQQRFEDLDTALNCFNRAVELDSGDYLSLHWIARVWAWKRRTNEAFEFGVKALQLYPHHLPTLQLVVLLLTSQKNYADALALIEETLDEFPDHLGFLQLKAALEEVVLGPEAALITLKQMLIIWKKLFEDGNFTQRCDSPDPRFPGSGLGTLQLPSPTDKESVASFKAHSVAGSSTNTALASGIRADAALSEIASTISLHNSMLTYHSSELAWAAQINIWLIITDLYLKADQPSQAAAALDEASQISTTHSDVLYYRGQVAEYCKEYSEARTAYESSVAVHATNIKALQSLALMQHYFGSHRLAEKTLQDALKLDPYDHYTWYNLGKVLETIGDYSEAADYMATAIEVEAIVPILPYSIIPVCFD